MTVCNLRQCLIHSILLFAFTVCGAHQAATAAESDRNEQEKTKDQEARTKVQKLIDQRKELLAKSNGQTLTDEELEEKKLVEVEPENILPGDLSSVYKVMPYKIRRQKWGQTFSVGYSQYNPLKYQSDFTIASQGDFNSLYGKAETPMIELAYEYKRNFLLGSLGLEFGYGYYSNTTNAGSVLGQSTLSVQPLRLGFRYSMDNIFYEPYVVPYISTGAYSVLFSERQGNVNFSGNTQAAGYLSFGAKIQLNWADPASAVASYAESGLENSFVFAELRQFMKSSSAKDPDFSSDLALAAGINFEF